MSSTARLTQAYEQVVRERGLLADASQRAAVTALEALAQRLQSTPPPGPWRRAMARVFPSRLAIRPQTGVYLYGSVGRGKTWLMDLFFANVGIAGRRRSHFHHLMRDVHQRLAAIDRRLRPLHIVAREIGKGCRLLCIDELFVSDIGDAMILHGLLSELLEQGVTLVITSNLAPAELYAGGLQRERFLPAIELLQSRLKLIRVDGPVDYRLRQLEQASTYLLTSDPDSQGKIEALFARLANTSASASGGPTSLIVEGRPIAARRSAAGMAWFDFADLCEGPRSQMDYIQLASELHTVFVTGIPVFDERSDDSARRFIALIDEFYDRNVKLIVEAAAEPAALYRGERLRFAFQRTASRLIEMRSRSYLAREHKASD